jgi:hypothetical protein
LQSAYGNIVEIVTGLKLVWPTLAKTRKGAENNSRINFFKGLIAHAQPIKHPRPKAFEHHVCAIGQGFENVYTARTLEVKGDAFLVSVQCEKVDTHTIHLGLYPTHVIPLVGAFHLDDFCTKITEQQGAIRAWEKTC